MLGLLLSLGCVGVWGALFVSVWRKPALSTAKSLPFDWETAFRAPIPPYQFPPPTYEDEVSDESPQMDGAVQVTLARLEEQVKGLQRDNRANADAMRAGLEAISKSLNEGIKGQSEILKDALGALRSEMVPRAEYNTVAFQVKFLWGAVIGLMAVTLSQIWAKIVSTGAIG